MKGPLMISINVLLRFIMVNRGLIFKTDYNYNVVAVKMDK